MTAVPRPFAFAALVLALGCATDPRASGDGGPSGGGGGAGGSGGSGSGGRTVPPGPPGLPVPPGPGDVARPSGTPGNLKVLNWAGFKSAATYTFDDAQPSQIEHYAALQATGVRHTFYITTGSGSGSAFDAAFTKAVQDGHEMGNHTVHHCRSDLSGCSNGSATSVDAELDGCNDYITGHFGQAGVWTAASPFGDTGWRVPGMTRFFLNRGVGNGTIAPNDNNDPFNLPCHPAVDGETVAMFNAQIDAAEAAGRWVIFLVHTLSPTAAVWYAPIDISVITDSVAHAKSLGDVWIDSMVNVGAYWRAQRILSSVAPTTAGDVQTWTWTLPDHFPAGRILRVTVDGGTPSQGGAPLTWDPHGYYEIALDAGSLTLGP
jgi:peptidoglycan/xylan/chitin deacetylase (PgdA/CDA1 family)